jgi:formate C-acetyltransferase
MDQYLYPYYRKEKSKKRITREGAKAILASFSIKMSEIIPVFSRQITRFHGGMFNGQVVTVGGVDKQGRDGTNELTYIFLEIMNELRMRQPNYHARFHSRSPRKYRDTVSRILAGGSNSPALYNDDIIIRTMRGHGYALPDARDYTAVGCVEPVSQGKSFSSTDAALVNVPILLEMALNRGKRFGSPVRTGARTLHPGGMSSMEDVTIAFRAQLRHMMARVITDLQAIELANRRYHPTPLTSMLLDDCLKNGICSTAGGARYNFSGIQCVGPADTGDALRAIEKAVFIDRRMTLPGLVKLLKGNFKRKEELAYFRNLVKYGNDDPDTDRWTARVVEEFTDTLEASGLNTRGGPYVTGLYSVTAHEFYGRVTGAMPHGRKKGEAFASGISPVNGADRKGPTALINSTCRIDFTRAANGINYNLKFSNHTLRGKVGIAALEALVKTYFQKGGMQVQINVLDRDELIRARDNPALHPNLLVRVSGYSAYFNDLTPAMKEEIISRTSVNISR